MDEGRQNLVENHFIATGRRRRWGLIAVGTALLLLGEPFGLPQLNPWLVSSFIGLGAGTNILAGWNLKRESRRWWANYLLVLIDLCLVGMVVAAIGPGGTILGFIYVVVPCFSRSERSLGIFAVISACIVYSVCVLAHPMLIGESVRANSPAVPILVILLFLGIAFSLQAEPYGTQKRIRQTQRLIRDVASGKFERRATADSDDNFGMLEQSLNELISRTSHIISDVSEKSEQVASVGGVVSQHADRLHASCDRVLTLITQLTEETSEQHTLADIGHNDGTEAMRDASGILADAETSQTETKQLKSVADLGMARIDALQSAITSVGSDVRRAAGIINEVSDQSRQIGSFALAISKIARHTHVLALNAAIEAAHADVHGQGFAVVAEQVRTLAGEAGGSARDVSNLIGEVQSGIENAAEVMVAGADKVDNINTLTNEAHYALDDVQTRAAQLSKVLSSSTELSAIQPGKLTALTERLALLARYSDTCAREVEEVKRLISAETETIADLRQTSQQITKLAEELNTLLD